MAATSVPETQENVVTVSQIHRQQFSLPQLPTTSVTIYPARATVIRNIKGIVLKPGRNEIILHQLTPRADENSIKVSGRLANGTVLLIADMTVDLVKPPTHKGENQTAAKKPVSWEPDSDEDEDAEQPVVSDNDTPTLKELSNKIEEVNSKIQKLREEVVSGDKQLHYLERWGTTLTDKDLSKGALESRSTTAISEFLSTYTEKRADIMAHRATCSEELVKWEKELGKLKKDKEKLSARILRKKVKAREERIREKEEERERRREEGKEDKDTKAPEKWYRVRVWIDREEDDELEGSNKIQDDGEGELELKYTVSDAGWASRYDIVISSAGDVSSTGGKVTAHLTYHAHFQNRTYEMWKDAWISLSTSQTVFTGLADGAPTLEPWRVRLLPSGGRYDYNHGEGPDSGAAILKNRAHAGLYSSQEKAGIDKEKKEERRVAQPIEVSRRALKSKGYAKSYMRKASAPRPSAAPAMSRFSSNSLQDSGLLVEGGDDGDDSEGGSSESEDETASMSETLTRTLTLSSINKPPPTPKPKSNFVTQGLTSSYSIPHRMTIPSTHASSGDLESSTSAVRRHTILTMPLNQIQLSYASAPKLRAAAYLKARILNDSSTTLRKGMVGVTLDGTFIGSTPLPRTVYPGGIFNLPLGIDESVTVTYAKPSVKRNAQKGGTGGGIFSSSIMSWGKGQQEMVATYGRSTVIRNNRLDRGAIELVVCDQVPVSEDARLVVAVTYPRGLMPPPPLLAPGTKNSKAIQEEPEMGEGDEGGEEGSSMRMGQPVKAGTGVYVEGFVAIAAQEEAPAQEPPKTQPAQPQKLTVPPVSTSAGSDDDNTSYKDTGKSKRKSLFFVKSAAPRASGGNLSQPPVQAQLQTQPANQDAQSSLSAWKSAISGKEEKWGSAVAAMRRNGEVVWKVKLNPGMGVRLGLEYTAKVPAGERIAGL